MFLPGNNWGNCPNGTGAVGCGPQEEFRACADIQIGKGFPETTESPYYTSTKPTTTQRPTSTTEQTAQPLPPPTYSPITALIISFVSFLVIFLVFLMLYFHYYQVGRRLKMWLKNEPRGLPAGAHAGEEKKMCAPMPPPRVKKIRKVDDMHEIDLKDESLA